MYKPFLKLMFALFILFDLASLTQAQVESSCFAKATGKISIGEKITLIHKDGSQISGHLQSIDTLASILHLYYKIQTDSETYSYQMSEIAKIKFKRPGKFRPGFSLLGLLVGGVAGGVIGAISGQSDPGYGGLHAAVGVVLGGGAGLLVGTVVGFATNSSRTIECE